MKVQFLKQTGILAETIDWARFNELFKAAKNPDAIDLLQKMLMFDPDKRITIDDALKHPYMAKYHDPNDEPIGDPVSAFDFDYELFSLRTSEYKELLY